MAAYLEAALEEGDATVVAAVLGDIARAKGMSDIARDTGLGRESLYKALSAEGNPEFSTILKVVKALGLRFHVAAPLLKGAPSAQEPVAVGAYSARRKGSGPFFRSVKKRS
jgi:probable addiction module antidote protein